jgi:hypothetical protein
LSGLRRIFGEGRTLRLADHHHRLNFGRRHLVLPEAGRDMVFRRSPAASFHHCLCYPVCCRAPLFARHPASPGNGHRGSPRGSAWLTGKDGEEKRRPPKATTPHVTAISIRPSPAIPGAGAHLDVQACPGREYSHLGGGSLGSDVNQLLDQVHSHKIPHKPNR